MLSKLIVIGTGFMGASIAAAAKSRGLALQVIGLDPKEADAAKAKGYIDSAADNLDAAFALAAKAGGLVVGGSSGETVGILIAAPVTECDAIFGELQAAVDRKNCVGDIAWVSDIGSTKHGVIKAAHARLTSLAPRFVSSHPMAGSEKHGAANANPDALKGARVLISPLHASPSTSSAAAYAGSGQDAIDELESFWLALGAIPNPLPIDDHDALLAAISHLPHVLAYSLATSLAQSPLAAAAQALHGGGLRDTTRIAASNPELWADIFLDNRGCLLDAWGEWALELEGMRAALEKSDRDLLIDLLARASQWRKGFQ